LWLKLRNSLKWANFISMEGCLFCAIINKKVPAEIIKEDDGVVIFKDIKPKARVHYLFVPKEHIESISSAGAEIIAMHLISSAKFIAKEQNIKGYKLLFNVNKEGGQEIGHLHLHFLAN